MLASPSSRISGARGGFTLLELLLVVCIIGAVTGLVIVSITNLPNSNRLARAADDVRAVLTGLRARAMEEGMYMEWSFQPDDSTFRVKRPNGSNGGGTAGRGGQWLDLDPGSQVDFASDVIFGEHRLPEGVQFRSTAPKDAGGNANNSTNANNQLPPNVVRFLPDGSANSLEFQLDDGFGVVNVQVRGLTGGVSVKRRPPSGGNGQGAGL